MSVERGRRDRPARPTSDGTLQGPARCARLPRVSGTLRAMIEVHAFRDGKPLEGHLTLGDAERLLDEDGCFVWIDVTDPQRDEIDALGAIFSLHPLTIEDAHHRHQRP